MPSRKPVTVTDNQSFDPAEPELVNCRLDGMTIPAEKLQVLLPVLLGVECRPTLRPKTMMRMPLRDNTVQVKARIATATGTGVSIEFSQFIDVHGASM